MSARRSFPLASVQFVGDSTRVFQGAAGVMLGSTAYTLVMGLILNPTAPSSGTETQSLIGVAGGASGYYIELASATGGSSTLRARAYDGGAVQRSTATVTVPRTGDLVRVYVTMDNVNIGISINGAAQVIAACVGYTNPAGQRFQIGTVQSPNTPVSYAAVPFCYISETAALNNAAIAALDAGIVADVKAGRPVQTAALFAAVGFGWDFRDAMYSSVPARVGANALTPASTTLSPVLRAYQGLVQ